METTLFIARLIGPPVALSSLIMLVDAKGSIEMAQEFIKSRALIMVAGIAALVAGLAIVNSHNIWTGNLAIFITLLGWIMIAAGIFRMAFPGLVRSLGERMLKSETVLRIYSLFPLLAGLWLTWAGYF